MSPCTLYALLKSRTWNPAHACVLADMLIGMMCDAVRNHGVLLREVHPRRIWVHPDERCLQHVTANVHELSTDADVSAAYVMLEKLLVALQDMPWSSARQLQYALLHALQWNSAYRIDPKHVQASLRTYPMTRQQTGQKYTYRTCFRTAEQYPSYIS